MSKIKSKVMKSTVQAKKDKIVQRLRVDVSYDAPVKEKARKPEK